MKITLPFFLLFALHVAIAQNTLGTNQTLVFATYQYADNPRVKNIEPLAKHISDALGIKTSVKSYATVHDLLAAMEKEEVDVVLINTFGYLLNKEKSEKYEAGVVLNIPKEKENSYKSIIATGNNSGISSLKQAIELAPDYVLFLVSTSSTSGNLVPRLKLSSLQPGIPERFFLEVQYTNTHAESLRHALANEFALCAFGSDEYYKLGADTVNVKKLWESPAIPLGPVMFKKSLSVSLREELQRVFLKLHETDSAALESVKAGWTEAKPADKYVLVDEKVYESLLQLSVNNEVAMIIIRSFLK